VFQDVDQVEAKRQGDFEKWTHKITAKIDSRGRVEVKSVSLGNEMWDVGKNSLRVKLFIFAFNEELKEYDTEKLAELEKEIEKKDNWDDYEVPNSLPNPKKFIEPQIIVPFLGAGLIAIALGYLIALLSLEGLYVIFLFEIGVGFIFGFAMKYLMKLGNYTDFSKIKLILIACIFLTFLLNQVFQYHLILARNDYEPIGFLAFMKLRLEKGLVVRDLNVGAIGLIISWIIQVGLSYLIAHFRTVLGMVHVLLDRVPPEVVDFAHYHFVKGKSEIAVKQELSKMGWSTDLQHKMVFEAIDGLQGGQILQRG
jgi:hypothetical protein